MKYRIAVALVAIASVAATASASPNRDTSPTPYSCDAKTMHFHVHRARQVLKAAYDLDNWEHIPRGDDLANYREHKRCVLLGKERARLAELRDKLAERLKGYADEQRQVSSLTPYAGPNGTHWAIPWSIVACESGGSWSAANPSGAIGPYQLLGHGAPWPVTSEADKLAHHRIAAALWAGGAGRSAWVC